MATSRIPRASFVCELKTNKVCLPDDFAPIVQDYKFKFEQVMALLVKVSHDEEMVYDCTRRLVQKVSCCCI